MSDDNKKAHGNPMRVTSAANMQVVNGSERWYCRVEGCMAFANMPYGYCTDHQREGVLRRCPEKLFPPIGAAPLGQPPDPYVSRIAEQTHRAEQAEAALAIEREKHDEEAYDDMQAGVAECLDEIRRLRAETTRLETVMHSTRPEIAALRRVAVLVSDLLVDLPMRLDTIQDDLRALLPPEDADLPTLGELRGCLSDGRARVEAALEATTQEITEREKHDNEVSLRAERQRPSS